MHNTEAHQYIMSYWISAAFIILKMIPITICPHVQECVGKSRSIKSQSCLPVDLSSEITFSHHCQVKYATCLWVERRPRWGLHHSLCARIRDDCFKKQRLAEIAGVHEHRSKCTVQAAVYTHWKHTYDRTNSDCFCWNRNWAVFAEPHKACGQWWMGFRWNLTCFSFSLFLSVFCR